MVFGESRSKDRARKRAAGKLFSVLLTVAMVLQGSPFAYAEEILAAMEQEDAVTPAVVEEPAAEGPVAEDATEESVAEDATEEAAPAEAEAVAIEGQGEADAESEPAEAVAAKTEYVYEDDTLKVTAKLDDAAAIPDDAQLMVTAITAESDKYNYDAYMTALNEGGQPKANGQNTMLYDVAFLVYAEDGTATEVQPTVGSVHVTFDFKKAQLESIGVEDSEQVSVTHLPLVDSAKADTTAQATNITPNDVIVEDVETAQVDVNADKVELEAKQFSVYAFSVPVERDDQDTYTYSDDDVEIIAVLSEPDALPNDAVLMMTKVTSDSQEFDYDAYMAALNKDAEKYGKSFTEKNTLLYDITFYTKDENGNLNEIQPAEGFVSIEVHFKKNQITKDLGIEDAQDINVIHLSVSDDASVNNMVAGTELTPEMITAETVEAKSTVEEETVSFEATSFSIWAFNNDGNITVPEVSTDTFAASPFNVLTGEFGQLANFGLVGFDSVAITTHTNSNIATEHLNLGGQAMGTNKLSSPGELSYIGTSITGGGTFNLTDGNNGGGTYNDSVIVLGSGINGTKIEGAPGDRAWKFIVDNNLYNVNGPQLSTDGGETVNALQVEKQGIKFLDLAALKGQAESLSDKFGGFGDTRVEKDFHDQNYAQIKIEDDVTVASVTLDARTELFGNGLYVDDHLVSDDKRHVLIINVDANGLDAIGFPGVIIDNDGDKQPDNGTFGEVSTWTKSNVIVNVIDSSKPDGRFTGNFNVNRLTYATIVAPDANVIANVNVNGEIIANKITIKQEFHRDSFTFDNYITVKGGMRAKKTLDDSSEDLPTYEFKLSAIDNAPLPLGAKDGALVVNNEADGMIYFGFITFEEPGEYKYTIEEVIPENPEEGIDYDRTKYTVGVVADWQEDEHGNPALVIVRYNIYDEDGNVVDRLDYEEGKTGVVTFNNTTNTQETTDVTVEKTWANADGSATWPKGVEVTFQLTADGKDVAGKTLTLSAAKTSGKFTGLPKYKVVDGKEVEIVYGATESDVAGYTSVVSAIEGGVISAANTQETTDVTVEKTWANADGSATWPKGVEVTFQLTADGKDVAGKTLTLSAAKTSGKFTGLPKYKVVDGKEVEIVYGATESDVAGYTSVVSAIEGGVISAANTQETTDVTVEKTWANADGSATWPKNASVAVALMADGEQVDQAVLTSESSSHTFTNLPEYKVVDGQMVKIEYKVEEKDVTGVPSNYNTTVAKKNAGFTITNSEITTAIEVKKTWANADGTDAWPENVTVTMQLKADGQLVEGKTATLDADHTSYIFGSLPRYNASTGKLISYTVEEIDVAGYTSSYGALTDGAITVTNKQDTTTYTVNKTWSNADGTSTWPENVTVSIQLTADGEAVSGKTATLSADQPSYTFENLPKYKAGSKNLIQYSAEELDVAGYTSAIAAADAGAITFNNTQDKGAFQLKKVVEGTNDSTKDFTFTITLDGSDAVVFGTAYPFQKLDKDGNEADSGNVTVTSPISITLKAGEVYKIDNLPVGTTWSVEETAIPTGYEKKSIEPSSGTIGKDAEAKVVATNTYSAAGSFQIAGLTKVLKNGELKAKQFSFQLKDADGKVLQTAYNDDSGNITFSAISYTLADLKGAASKKFSYTVNEVVPAGATKNADGTYTAGGITYSGDVVSFEVTVSDNGDGTLKIEGAEGGKVDLKHAFVNSQQEKKQAEKKKLAKTSDLANPGLMAGIAGAGLAIVVIGLINRRRRRDQ